MPGWGVHQRRGRSIIMRRWRASMPELAACTCTRLTGSLGLYRFNRTAHPWLGGGGGSRPRRAVDSDYDDDTRICHSISIDVIPYRSLEGARSKEQGAGSKEQGAVSREQGARSREHRARSKEQGARSKEQGAREEQGAGSRSKEQEAKEQGARGKEQGARSKEQGARSKEHKQGAPAASSSSAQHASSV